MPDAARVSWPVAVALVAIALATALNVSARVAHESLCCGDDALFAVVAKNLAAGDGYRSTFSPNPAVTGDAEIFDPSTTTGPTLVVPVAAAIRLLGNRYWVPGATTALIAMSLLGALAIVWRSDLGSAGWRALLWLLVLLQLATISLYALWFAMLGELPAALLLVLGASLLARDPVTPRRAFAAGFALSAAFLTKTIALIGVAAIVGVLVCRAMASLRKVHDALATIRSGPLMLGASGFLVPLAAFEGWKFATLGPSGYLHLKSAERSFLAEHDGSGISRLAASSLRGVTETLPANWGVLVEFLGGPASAAALLAALVVGVLAFRRMRTRTERLVVLLAAAAFTHTAWWLLGSTAGWTRHLAPALVYLSAAVAIAVSGWPLDRRGAAIAVLVLVAFAPRVNRLAEIVARTPLFEPSQRTRAMIATVHYLDGLAPDDVKAATSWFSVMDLEFLSARSRNFVYGFRIAPVDRPGVYLVSSRRWTEKSREVAENWKRTVEAWNGELVFEADPYEIYRAGEPPEMSATVDAEP